MPPQVHNDSHRAFFLFKLCFQWIKINVNPSITVVAKNLIAKIYIPGPWWLEDFFAQK